MNKNNFFCWILPKNSVIHPLQAWAGFFFLLFFSIPFLSGISAAQSEKEMKVLQMFFEEKDLFSSVTRNPKPVSQIAENVTIVTAKEIEAMNARTVAEVLDRVTGLFVNFSQGKGTAGSTSLLHVQGSEDRHVLVLVDGIPWNSMAGGSAETNTIPVGIIERIEIIKGPASSSWGSSLGGAVHIITKSPGYTSGPAGSVRTSYGEMETTDHRAQISGRAGRLGYYLFGGRQDSDGPEDARDYENTAFFSRFSYTASNRMAMELSLGYTRPETGLGIYESQPFDFRSSGANRNFWTNARLDAAFTRELSLKLHLFRFEQETGITSRESDDTGSAGTLYRADKYEEATTGGRAKLIWKKGLHTVVAGMDFNHGDLDQTSYSGQFLQAQGAPAYFHTRPDLEKTGVFVNDTIVLDRLSVTPGIRYDRNSEIGSFLSPSLGLAYTLGNETILRGSVARGVTAPPLSWTSGGALGLDPNPSLEEETVWSYQAGVESAALQYVWLKGILFRHEIEDIFQIAPAPGDNWIWQNNGDSRRQGIEIEIETLPLYHTSLEAGWAYVDLDPTNDFGAENMYTYNVGITYDHPDIVRAELFGHYIWWDAQRYPDYKHDDFIWDLNVRKKIYTSQNIQTDLFATIHNLFNDSQYLNTDNPNPDRWIEAGLKMHF